MKYKICAKCHSKKSLVDNFGLLTTGYYNSYCKKCKVKIAAFYKKRDIVKHRIVDKLYQRRKRKEYPDIKKIEDIKYKKRYKKRMRAVSRLHYALNNGRIKKLKCRDCERKDTHAHHPDYSKPLEVIWLCPSHHKLEHLKKQK